MPDWNNMPVRRLIEYIEDSLRRDLQWTVFEPNGPVLWDRVRDTVTAFMTELWKEGAFAGDSVAEAFYVVCDESTTTPEDVGAGRVNVTVGFAPVVPGEFVVLTLQFSAAVPG